MEVWVLCPPLFYPELQLDSLSSKSFHPSLIPSLILSHMPSPPPSSSVSLPSSLLTWEKINVWCFLSESFHSATHPHLAAGLFYKPNDVYTGYITAQDWDHVRTALTAPSAKAVMKPPITMKSLNVRRRKKTENGLFWAKRRLGHWTSHNIITHLRRQNGLSHCMLEVKTKRR